MWCFGEELDQIQVSFTSNTRNLSGSVVVVSLFSQSHSCCHRCCFWMRHGLPKINSVSKWQHFCSKYVHLRCDMPVRFWIWSGQLEQYADHFVRRVGKDEFIRERSDQERNVAISSLVKYCYDLLFEFILTHLNTQMYVTSSFDSRFKSLCTPIISFIKLKVLSSAWHIWLWRLAPKWSWTIVHQLRQRNTAAVLYAECRWGITMMI